MLAKRGGLTLHRHNAEEEERRRHAVFLPLAPSAFTYLDALAVLCQERQCRVRNFGCEHCCLSFRRHSQCCKRPKTLRLEAAEELNVTDEMAVIDRSLGPCHEQTAGDQNKK